MQSEVLCNGSLMQNEVLENRSHIHTPKRKKRHGNPGCAQRLDDDKEPRPLPSVLQMQSSVAARGKERRRPICLLKEFYVLRAAS